MAIQWTTYITNLSRSPYSEFNINTLYRSRWQIELLFKLFKSEGGLEGQPERTKKGYKHLCMFYARMIGILLVYNIMLLEGGMISGKSPTKMYRRILKKIPALAKSIYDNDPIQTKETIIQILEALRALKPQHKRNKHPSTRDLLLNAEIMVA